MDWHKAEPNPADNDDKPDTMPPPDHTVLVIYLSDYDDKPLIAFGGRSDAGEGEGWLWGIEPSNHFLKDGEAEIVCDDEYRVTHWAEIEWPA